MLKDGYKEGDVVPIATQQAEKWYKDASKEELDELKTNILRSIRKINLRIRNLMKKISMSILKMMNGK